MRRPVKCRSFTWLFLSRITLLFDRWNCFLCLYRRPSVRIVLRTNFGPGGLRRSTATYSYHSRPRLANFRWRLWRRCLSVLSSALIFRLALDTRRFDTVCSHRLIIAFYHHFEYAAAPCYDLIQSVVRGSEWWCYCDSSQKYMWRAPYIGTCLFDMCRTGGWAGDATWLHATYLRNFPSQYWRRQYNSL